MDEVFEISKSFILSETCKVQLLDIWKGERFEVAELLEIERTLHACKLQIRTALTGGSETQGDEQNQELTSAWHAHTSARDPASLIVPYLRQNYSPELCTNAWAKIFEILAANPDLLCTVPEPTLTHHSTDGLFQSEMAEPLTPPAAEPEGQCRAKVKGLVSVHLCEAPGAFVSALNHFLALRQRLQRNVPRIIQHDEEPSPFPSPHPNPDDGGDSDHAVVRDGSQPVIPDAAESADAEAARGRDASSGGGWQWTASSMVAGPRLDRDPIAARMAAAAAAAAASEDSGAAGAGAGASARDDIGDMAAGTAAHWHFGADGTGPEARPLPRVTSWIPPTAPTPPSPSPRAKPSCRPLLSLDRLPLRVAVG